MLRNRIVSRMLTTVILLMTAVVYAESPGPDERAKQVQKQLEGMDGTLKRFLREVAKAREANDIRKLNCLVEKLNLVKGLLKASERAKLVLLEASFNGDKPTADAYSTKLTAYRDGVNELEKSINECVGSSDSAVPQQALLYVKPEGSAELTGELPTPWDADSVEWTANVPIVPPATPFQ